MDISSNKKVSIIIPCFNYGRYIGECIESVLNQTYPIHEIIVVDDESTDNTKEVVESFSTRHVPQQLCPIHYIWQKNKGLAGARNTGIKAATGEYIQCIDADDKMTPAAVEEHVKLMRDDMTIAQCALMEFGDRHVVMIPNFPTSLERILKSNTIYCNAMFAKKVWEAVGGYDEGETMRLGREDHEFWVRCLDYGCVVNASDFIALRYRCHEGQMTQATLHPRWEEVEAYFRSKHADLYDKYNLN